MQQQLPPTQQRLDISEQQQEQKYNNPQIEMSKRSQDENINMINEKSGDKKIHGFINGKTVDILNGSYNKIDGLSLIKSLNKVEENDYKSYYKLDLVLIKLDQQIIII